jgi:hypothetical protein
VIEEIYDDDLSPSLKSVKRRDHQIDYDALRRFIETNFPIYKTETLLKVAECLENQSESQKEYHQYVDQLSDKDVNLLISGIKASLAER